MTETPELVVPAWCVVFQESEGFTMRWMRLNWLLSLPSHVMASAVQFCKGQIERWRVMVDEALDF